MGVTLRCLAIGAGSEAGTLDRSPVGTHHCSRAEESNDSYGCPGLVLAHPLPRGLKGPPVDFTVSGGFNKQALSGDGFGCNAAQHVSLDSERVARAGVDRPLAVLRREQLPHQHRMLWVDGYGLSLPPAPRRQLLE